MAVMGVSWRDGNQAALGLTCMLVLLVASATAKDIVVGGSNGWTVVGITPDTYQSQINAAGAQVGDVLVFNHTSSHNVVQLPTEVALEACDFFSGNTLSSGDATATPFRYTLSGSPGTTFYFMCSIGTHCQLGMHFNVTLAAVGAPAPAPAPVLAPTPGPSGGSPPPAGSSPPTTPAPSPSVTPASPPPATLTPAASPSPAPAPGNGASVNARGISVACVVALVAACVLGA